MGVSTYLDVAMEGRKERRRESEQRRVDIESRTALREKPDQRGHQHGSSRFWHSSNQHGHHSPRLASQFMPIDHAYQSEFRVSRISSLSRTAKHGSSVRILQAVNV